MDVHVVTGLGSWISYGKDEVAINQEIYDSVPVEFKEELESLASRACSEYHRIVKEAKARGEKIKPMSVKKQTMDDLRRWVKSHQTKEVTIVKSFKPRIPSNNEIPRVVQKQSYFSDVKVSKEEIESLFNNFDSESLQDEVIELPEEDTMNVSLDDDLFEEGDLLEGLEDF